MKTAFSIVAFALLLSCSKFIKHSVDAHEAHSEHHHGIESEYLDDHDESVEHNHFDHDHHHYETHRGLRNTEPVTPMSIGNHTYASKHKFIHSGHRCGSKKPSKEQRKKANDVLSKWVTDQKHRRDQAALIEIETYLNVITAGTVGAISDATLKSQLDILNKYFKSYGFKFRLMKTTRTNNLLWYNAVVDSRSEAAMFDKLRVGDASTMNVYFSAADGYLGYATLPENYEDFPDDDGVVIASGSVPGGSIPDYNMGKTLVHEVGHWLGLEHTFATNHFSGNGCFGSGDGVSDTPKQRSATEGCPTRRDSCPRSAGVDMVSNFMDYSDDICLTRFTTGQKNRMLAMWDEYRA